jgi:hypothetical protein
MESANSEIRTQIHMKKEGERSQSGTAYLPLQDAREEEEAEAQERGEGGGDVEEAAHDPERDADGHDARQHYFFPRHRTHRVQPSTRADRRFGAFLLGHGTIASFCWCGERAIERRKKTPKIYGLPKSKVILAYIEMSYIFIRRLFSLSMDFTTCHS